MKSERLRKSWMQVMLSAMLTLYAGSGIAQNLPQIRELKPAPSVNPLPEVPNGTARSGTDWGEEVNYHGNGKIDRIGDGEIVIDDRLWPLAPRVDYRSRSNGSAFSSQFKAGSSVRYRLNSRRQIDVLWLMGNRQ